MTAPFLFVPTFSWPAAPGGLLYTYAAGGTTQKTTYSDAAGTVPNANPVVLDSNGSATVRLGSGAYHFVLKDSTGTTTLWDQDQYQSPAGPQIAADGIGAIGDGTTDNTTIINNEITALSAAGGGTIYFTPGLTYAHSTSITLKSNVWLSGLGSATLKYTGSGQQFTSPTSSCLQGAGIVGMILNAGSSSTKILELFSPYQCTFRDLLLKATSTTNFAIDILVNTSGTTNVEGNRNAAFNMFEGVIGTGTFGTGVRLKGDSSAPTVVTLNTFSGVNIAYCAVRGIDFNSWCDSNRFIGVTRIGLQSITNAAGVGVEWNSGTPGSNVGVYANNFDHLAVDAFGAPSGDARIGIKMGWTKLNKVDYFFQEPAAAGGAYVIDGTNTQSYNINHCIASTSNMVMRTKNWFWGGADACQQAIGGGGDISTQDTALLIGVNRTGSGNSYVSLIGDTTNTSYGLRLLRTNGGVNAQSSLLHKGTGNLIIQSQDAGGQVVLQDSTGAKFGLGNGGIAFFGVALQAQFTTGGASSAFTVNAGTAVNDASTFDGYTIKQLVKAMRSFGLLA